MTGINRLQVGAFVLEPVDKEAKFYFETGLQLWYYRPDRSGLSMLIVEVVDVPFGSRFVAMSNDLQPGTLQELLGEAPQLEPGINYAIMIKTVQ